MGGARVSMLMFSCRFPVAAVKDRWIPPEMVGVLFTDDIQQVVTEE